MASQFSEDSDSTLTQSTQDTAAAAPVPTPPEKPKGSIKCRGVFCTGPRWPGMEEHFAGMQNRLKEQGIKVTLAWWGACEEMGKPNEAHPEGYHHGHLVMMFTNTTTIGKTNTPKFQRAVSPGANWCINKLKGRIRCARYSYYVVITGGSIVRLTSFAYVLPSKKTRK